MRTREQRREALRVARPEWTVDAVPEDDGELTLTDLERKRDDLGKATARHKSRPIWNALSAWEQGAADLRRLALKPRMA